MKTLLLTYALIKSTAAAPTESGVHHVPLFRPSELLANQGHLAETLATTGLLAVQLPSAFDNNIRTAALNGLCQCSSSSAFSQLEGADRITLGDGQTIRSTLATATIGTSPLPLAEDQVASVCGLETAQAMEALRDQVAEASGAFLQALDQLIGKNEGAPILHNSYGGSYDSVSSIVQAASNLEHFHVYSKSSSETTTKPALELHTDAGLFLAFVPAFTCGSPQNPDQSLYLKDAYGTVQRAVFPPHSIAIMLGAGAEHWLTSQIKLRATRHAVQMDPGVSRAWYGMMHLVPESAIVEKSPQRTFGEMRQAMILKSQSSSKRLYGDDPLNDQSQDISIGCGFSDFEQDTDEDTLLAVPARRRRLQHVENAGACNNITNFYCWMSCLDIPNQGQAEGYQNEGQSLYCVDPSIVASSGSVSQAQEPCIMKGVVGLAMNSNCMGMWQPTAPGVPAQEVVVLSAFTEDLEEPFCYGGTSMYMDGFQWMGSTCIIYLFPRFVITSAGGMVGACFFTIFFGMALEWVIQRRRVTVQKFSPGYERLAVSATFYGVQLTMGYSIMLVIMIYSIPLFISVVVGIVSGHVLFSAPDAILKKKKAPIPASGDATTRDKWSDVPEGEEEEEKGGCCGGEEGDNAMNSSSNAEHIPGFGASTCSRRRREDSPSQSQDLEVPEGSTPCCQHAV